MADLVSRTSLSVLTAPNQSLMIIYPAHLRGRVPDQVPSDPWPRDRRSGCCCRPCEYIICPRFRRQSLIVGRKPKVSRSATASQPTTVSSVSSVSTAVVASSSCARMYDDLALTTSDITDSHVRTGQLPRCYYQRRLRRVLRLPCRQGLQDRKPQLGRRHPPRARFLRLPWSRQDPPQAGLTRSHVRRRTYRFGEFSLKSLRLDLIVNRRAN